MQEKDTEQLTQIQTLCAGYLNQNKGARPLDVLTPFVAGWGVEPQTSGL